MSTLAPVHPKLSTDEASTLEIFAPVVAAFLPRRANVGELILRAYLGKVWLAMGYQSFREWGEAEAIRSKTRMYQLLAYGRILATLAYRRVDSSKIHAEEALDLTREIREALGPRVTCGRKATDTDPHCIYTMRDAKGCVLYVGISVQTAVRISSHAGSSNWWRGVRSIEVEHCAGRLAALLREAALIKYFRPIFNVSRRGILP